MTHRPRELDQQVLLGGAQSRSFVRIRNSLHPKKGHGSVKSSGDVGGLFLAIESGLEKVLSHLAILPLLDL